MPLASGCVAVALPGQAALANSAAPKWKWSGTPASTNNSTLVLYLIRLHSYFMGSRFSVPKMVSSGCLTHARYS